MPRYHQAPWDYDCIYKHCCPHLQGLSTKWAFEEYQRSYDENLQHWKARDIQQEELEKALAYIGKLEKENEVLNAKLKALHRRQFKSNKKPKQQSSENGSNDRSTSGKKKKRGAPKGHPGWFRLQAGHFDKTVFVDAPDHCPHCACTDLTLIDEIKDHLQEDIVLVPRTFVINFSHQQAYCPKCRRAVIQAAEGELLNCPIGPTTKAAAVYLRYGLNIPYRKVKELFEVFF